MSITHSTPIRNGVADYVTSQIDAGGGAGKLVIKAGATVLSTHTMSAVAFGDAVNGVATAASISDATVTASGTPDSWEMQDFSGAVIFQGSAGAVGSGEDLEIDVPAGGWLAGGTVSIDSGSYTAPV